MRISDWSSDVCSSDLQQNVDLTYRLYDYGRPRDLHLDAGIAVSEGTPFIAQPAPGKVSGDRTILAEGPKFVLERWPAGHRKVALPEALTGRSEEHTSELQSLMRISYAVFCLQKKKYKHKRR